MLNHTSRLVKIGTLTKMMEDLLAAVGFDEETARIVAGIHLESDLRGVSVQGFNHLVYTHLQKYMEGKADPGGKPEITREGASYALINGNNGPGPLAALMACDVAIKKAKDSGASVIGINNSNDLFQAGLYAEMIAREGLVSMIFSDDVVPVVHPLGGAQPVIGSNPLAWAVPTGDDPFLLDFTPCATLPTYVRYSQKYNAEMEPGLVHDAEGNPTTDPFKVCTGIGHSLDTGAIDPGGHKGYGMLMFIDFISGALVGADMGMDHVTRQDSTKGHIMFAIDPNAFGSLSVFQDAVKARMDYVRNSRKAPGVDAIRMPGEGSFSRRRKALETGEVQIDTLCWADSLELAKQLGVEVAEAS